MGRDTVKKLLVVAIAALWTLGLASPAAGSVTLGQLAPGAPDTNCSGSGPTDELQPTVTAGNSYVVPSSGAITSWSNKTAVDPNQQLTFKVFRPNGGGSYTVVGHDGPRPLVSNAVNTFATRIPVVAGDVIGLHHGDTAAESTCNFDTTDTFFERAGDLLDGQSGVFLDYGPGNCCYYRLNVTAVFEPTNAFALGKVKRKANGTATVTVNVPNPGELTASGKGVKASSAAWAVTAKSVTPPTASLKIKAKGSQLRTLNEAGKVKLKAKITYTPTGGDPKTQVLKLKLRKS
jgi:hypothetical protein